MRKKIHEKGKVNRLKTKTTTKEKDFIYNFHNKYGNL